MLVVFYISGHGLGHASRATELVGEWQIVIPVRVEIEQDRFVLVQLERAIEKGHNRRPTVTMD